MVNHSNPRWTDEEIELLLENYDSKEMHELQDLLARCYFPRPAEGIKRKLEKLFASGQFPLDKDKVKYLATRKLWHKDTYAKYKEQLRKWRKENPGYFSKWFDVHPGYYAEWIKNHRGNAKKNRKAFFAKHPHYERMLYNIQNHIDSLLADIFIKRDELRPPELLVGIKNLSGISLKERTLEKLLLRYESNPRGPPIVKTEAGNYRLNNLFYKS